MLARLATVTAAAVVGTVLAAAPASASASWSLAASGPTGGICYRMPATGPTAVTLRMDGVSLRHSSASYVTVLRHGRVVGSASGGNPVGGSHNVTRTLPTAQAGDVFRVRHLTRSNLTGTVVRAIDYDVAAVRGTWCRSGMR